MRYCLCDNRTDIRCDNTHCDIASLDGGPGNANACRVCWIRLNGPPPVAAKVPLIRIEPAKCVHLGVVTDEKVECPSCNGKVLIKLHECSIYSRCSPYKAITGVHYCPHCPDFKDKME